MFEKKPHAFLHSTGRTMTFAHLLIYLFLGILPSGCGDSTESANSEKSVGMDSIREDVYKPNYGERDPIALDNTTPGGTFSTWGGSFPKSLNMFLDYNSFSRWSFFGPINIFMKLPTHVRNAFFIYY